MVLLAACAVIFIMHEAYAQQQLAEPAVNENINAELNSNQVLLFPSLFLCSLYSDNGMNERAYH